MFSRVYISNHSTAQKRCILKAFGITHILMAESDEDPKYPEDFEYKVIKVDDTRDEQISLHFESAAQFIKGALDQKDDNNVLVHCWAGLSRSPTLVSAFLIKEHRMEANHALSTINRKRSIKPNDGFKKQLDDYQKLILGCKTKTVKKKTFKNRIFQKPVRSFKNPKLIKLSINSLT